MSITDSKRTFGSPISKHKVRDDNGVILVYDGGPLDLSNPKTATRKEVVDRAKDDIEGIIYETDKTYKYFVWLTVSRRYFSGGGVDGNSPEVVSIKVPFLLWFGSDMSFLNFEVVDYFFDHHETNHTQLPIEIDGEQFIFQSPTSQSRFSHYCILGRDFLESRFRAVEADYQQLTVTLKRRKKSINRELTPEWIRIRDKDLEKYLDDDDSDEGEGGVEENNRENGWSNEESEEEEEGEISKGGENDSENKNGNIDPALLGEARDVRPRADDAVKKPKMMKKRRSRSRSRERDEKVENSAIDCVFVFAIDEGGDAEMDDCNVNQGECGKQDMGIKALERRLDEEKVRQEKEEVKAILEDAHLGKGGEMSPPDRSASRSAGSARKWLGQTAKENVRF
ncbi:hypothetical protein ABW19_dt0208915 [Dactylella cylindrospora]|nr:hypothetical protein ABW19_dt0208915 [Dactylella cylindrospora]